VVVGYVTVDTHASASPESLATIHSICREAGWELRTVIHDEEITDVLSRPGLARALDLITTGQARALVIGDVRRLTPSLNELGTLLEWFRNAGARLIVPEVNLDTGTRKGAETASTLIRLSRGQPHNGAESGRGDEQPISSVDPIAGRS
jgi:DNA invertase Pin-like site-specific DNA recombinase